MNANKPTSAVDPINNTKNMTLPRQYSGLLNGNLQPLDSLPATKWHKERNLDRAIQVQKNPYADPTQVSKGVTSTTAGGSFTLYDKTGGTAIFTYNPSTGVVTINGALVANIINSGTYSNIVITGNSTLAGTLANGVIGTASLVGGTVNAQLQGSLTGTIGYPVQSGTSSIGTQQFNFQTKGGSVVLVYQLGGVNYFWNPAGVL